MEPLNVELRNKLERVIIEARDVAEVGAKAALEALAVHHYEPYGHMSPEIRRLRNHLRARARQLGDKQDKSGNLEINHLVQECAYEHWHRMIFARFLAENDLLIESESGVAISLDECEEIAKEEGSDLWKLASGYAQLMLPQIFRSGDPVLQLSFAREYQIKLEQLLNGLELEVFKASDSLGWVYQFWQSKHKKQVNDSGGKIGADELPAVTQLFTEPYMVNFLIHNTLGAWYAGRVLETNPELAENAKSEEELRKAVSVPGLSWDYLRFVRDGDSKGPWRPAAGTFDGWPKRTAELKILDPCCGSGHFLVALLRHLVPLRMAKEGLSAKDACDAVIKDNLHGLEIDERCTQIAAFALAFAVWTYPGAGGYRQLPNSRIACSGIAPNAKKNDWANLAGKDQRLREGMAILYELFQEAPTLGSLIDPKIAINKNLFDAQFDELLPLLKKALKTERKDYEQNELQIAAFGVTDAVHILGGLYHLVITNVPYLARNKQNNVLREYCSEHYNEAKNDIATVFFRRLFRITSNSGIVALVMPQNWLFLSRYKSLRKNVLLSSDTKIISLLGSGAFETISGEIVQAMLLVINNQRPEKNNKIYGLDVSNYAEPSSKAQRIMNNMGFMVAQKEQLQNPDSRILLKREDTKSFLMDYADSRYGLRTADASQFIFKFWEIPKVDGSQWVWHQSTVSSTTLYGGRDNILRWENGVGALGQYAKFGLASLQGGDAWGKHGIAVSLTGDLPITIYTGEKFDNNCAIIWPLDNNNIDAIYAFCESKNYSILVRDIDPTLKVTNATLLKVPFELKYWQQIAKDKYPNGLPKPFSNDPTQWAFHGHPVISTNPLQVAVIRLLGYSWPVEIKNDMDLSKETRKLISLLPSFNILSDDDGIVCIPSVRGEDPSDERLRALLRAAFGDNWSVTKEKDLITSTGSNAKGLDEWLRNDFFEQHCKLFQHRPFIWHIWDGRRRDGFQALVNYHKLAEGGGKGHKVLESLTYSYLGDWIARQKDGVKRGEGGAEDRLVAAVELQNRLIAILKGEPPFDIFVRWKPIENQPIGWEPDINDGVRINIRPFMSSDIPGGRKGAGVLRWKPNINWSKDRGKEPKRPFDQYPWFWKDREYVGDRLNDIHLTNEEKGNAREKAVRKSGSGY